MDRETSGSASGFFFPGSEDFSDDGTDLDETSCTIGLGQTGDDGTGYRIRNKPSDPYQRETVTDQKGPVQVRCKSREVVHGCLDTESGELGTLLVYDFTFNAAKLGRRIISADITLRFHSSVPGKAAPTVHKFAPCRRYILEPTSQDEQAERGTDLSVNAGQFGVNAGGGWRWATTTTRTTSDATEVRVFTKCNEFGDEDGVNWTLHENKTAQTGIPSFLRTAILLKREHNEEFQGTIHVEIEADWKTQLRLGRLFGSKDEDEPILFDPQRPPTRTLRPGGYDVENLDSVSLDELVDVTFYTKIEGAVKSMDVRPVLSDP